jgi:branched-chain amino acid aminotransferase
MKIYIDGEYYDRSEAKISVFDHGLLYGDGVFEGIRVYHGKVFRLREHIARLYASAKALALDIPLDEGSMASVVADAVRENKTHNGYIRLIVTRGQGSLGLDPGSCERPTVIVIVGDIQLYPREYYQKGIRLVTASTRRIPSECLDPRIKSLNYLNNIMAKTEAKRAGALEAVMLNTQGYVAECTADNIFIVKNGGLLTPDPSHGALDGITRAAVRQLAEESGINSAETGLTQYDLYTADECFITGTGAEVMPVIGIDDRVIGEGKPGPVTLRLMEAYRKLVAV